MNGFPKKLAEKLAQRSANNALRSLSSQNKLTDFASNDYLGFARTQKSISTTTGSTGSRLLTGNHPLHEKTEQQLATFYNSPAALLFNSGYDANIGLFSSVPQKGDFILYDELIHASIRDGIRLSNATAFKFKHNSLEALEKKIQHATAQVTTKEIYIAIESVYSMDGDSPSLTDFILLAKKYHCHLIVDEAHANGVFGKNGRGLLHELQLEDEVFATVQTFGKALGCHGAVILGSNKLKTYLINFAHSFIYTTALPPHAIATILANIQALKKTSEIAKLHENIQFFKECIYKNNLTNRFIESNSPVQSCLTPGNTAAKNTAQHLQQNGFDVRPILAPTVPEGQERLRFCLHSYNTKEEIATLTKLL